MKTYLLHSKLYFFLPLLIFTFNSYSQQTWNQANNTTRGTQFYNSSGALGYSVRTASGGGWAWQLVDGNPISYFQVQYPTGSTGIGLNNLSYQPQTGFFEVRNGATLGSTQGSNILLTCLSATSATNYLQNNVWVRRDGSGSDWFTTRFHDAISVDVSYLTPSVNTRTWWERSPFQDMQLWGDLDKTYMMLKAGNLGIGTTDTKGYKLAVAGKIISEEVVVKLQANWPDYVFDKSYRLLALKEVETFIEQNKHLPEMPSAEEVQKNGVQLGEMNSLLLKKIEEMTLYLIEQQKQIEMLKSEIIAIKNKQ